MSPIHGQLKCHINKASSINKDEFTIKYFSCMHNKDQKIKDLSQINDDLENYFRNTIIPQIFIDAALVLRKFTPPAMKQFSLSNADLGRHIDDIKDNFRFPTIIENIRQVINSNEILEKEIQTVDMRWYQMNIVPYITKQDNKNNGVIITFVEITARIKDLKDQEKLISDHETLLDTISHDIKNPLTSLILTIELLKNISDANSKQFQSLIQIVENSISTVQAIIEDLTDSRKKRHKYKAEVELLSFENILEDVRLSLTDNIVQSGAMIKSEINTSEIIFSRRKLRSIIYNLINNAIKYKSPDRKPEIVIKTEINEDFIIITVKDNGMGIDPSKTEEIFSKYYRVENNIEGSGIGLYLVKEIVNNAGGKISVKSQVDEGSEFIVYLQKDGSI